MRKELVSVIDLQGYWSNILCVSCSEGKKISTFEGMVENIKECQPQLAQCEFVLENDEIYALVDDNIAQINPGENCK